MPRYSEQEARSAVAASTSYTEALRRLGMRAAGGNHRLFRSWVDGVWKIPTGHFNPRLRPRDGRLRSFALEEVLVENSTYGRANVKRRVLEVGLKHRVCELCGQDEMWRGKRISLILDHINGVPNDHRIENLRMLCPNCNATLDTHCGKRNRRDRPERSCVTCQKEYPITHASQKFCSQTCANKRSRVGVRRVERPPFEQLLREIEETNFLAVGRKYGVSDNAIRKWVRAYEAESRQSERSVAEAAPFAAVGQPLAPEVRGGPCADRSPSVIGPARVRD